MKRFYTVNLIALLILNTYWFVGFRGAQRMFAAGVNPWESSIITILSAFAFASIAAWIALSANKALRREPANWGTIFTQLTGVSGRDPNQLMLKILSQADAQCPNSIIISDVKGKIEYVNQTFSKISGYAADEVVGRTPRIF
jgi:PAS domain-containing protein